MSKLPPAASVAVLISGRGSNMRALLEYARAAAAAPTGAAYEVALVLSDKAGAAGLAVAAGCGVATQVLVSDPAGGRAGFDRSLAAALDTAAPALIVLAGFMRILTAEFVERYAGRILNIHPSLLPRHPGLHTHRRVLAAQDAVHGATVHFVTPELDAGPRIIQARVAVLPGDDEATLAARVRSEEHRIYPLAVDWYCRGRLRCHGGRAWLDGRALGEPLLYDGADPSWNHSMRQHSLRNP